MESPDAVRINVVLAPGYMLDCDLWADIDSALQKVGRLSYADFSKDSTIEAMADRLLDDAPERFVLIGFSMGGYVAREAARRAPQRVSGLILIATSSRGDARSQAQREASATGAPGGMSFTGLSRRAILSSLAADNPDEAMVARIRAMGQRLGADAFRRQSSLVRAGDTHRLDEINCPTLVIAATEDRLRGLDEAQELHSGIAQSTLVTIAVSGHMIPLEAPAVLADVIVRWIGGLPSSGS